MADATTVDELADLRAQVATLQADLAHERARRTLGGTPPGYTPMWQPGTLTAPETATQDDAPPLRTELSSDRQETQR